MKHAFSAVSLEFLPLGKSLLGHSKLGKKSPVKTMKNQNSLFSFAKIIEKS